MEKRGDEVHASETEASGGSKEGVVRWVLIIGLILAIVALTLIWTTGAVVQQDGADSETNVSKSAAPSIEGTTSAPEAVATPGVAPAGDPKPVAE